MNNPSFFETYNSIFLLITALLLIGVLIKTIDPFIRYIEGKILNRVLGIIVFVFITFQLNEKAKSNNPFIYKDYKITPIRYNSSITIFGYVFYKVDSTETIILQVKLK